MILSVYSGADQIAHLIEVILLFAVVLVATYYTTRFIAGYEKGKLSAGNLKIIDTMRLSQNKILQIIRVGDKYLAIAVCKDSVTVLCELSEDEINAKIKEAEQYAEEDKKQKEAVETKNQSEGMIFEIEKQLKDLGDKVTESEKQTVEAAKNDLQAAIDAGNVDDMKAKMEALTNAFYPISTRIYQEAQAAQGGAGAQGFDPNNMGGAGFNPNMGGASQPNDGTVDADYEVVDDEE